MRAALRAGRRRLRRLRRPSTRAIILLYHSVSEAAFDPWALCVRPEDFAAHLEILRRRARVLSLNEMLDALERGTLPERAVAITFDDGFVDNLEHARPHLERHGFPATVFVTAGLVGSGRSFWWDELVELTLAALELPKVVRLSIAGRPISFSLGVDAAIDTASPRYRSWRFDDPPPSRRHQLCRVLWQRLQPLPDEARREVLRELREQVRCGESPPALRIMDEEELRDLAAGGLIEVGAHTLTHPVLARLPVDKQVEEISGSKAALERILGAPMANFSYPHGGADDFSPETVQAVREAGFRSACTTTEHWLRSGTDPYRLPRVHVPPLDGAGFERLLDDWL